MMGNANANKTLITFPFVKSTFFISSNLHLLVHSSGHFLMLQLTHLVDLFILLGGFLFIKPQI